MAEESHPWIREVLALTSAGGIVNINVGTQGDFVVGVGGDFIKDVHGTIIKDVHGNIIEKDVDGNIIEVPRFVALKSKYVGRYLRLTENDGSLPAGFLKFEGEKLLPSRQSSNWCRKRVGRDWCTYDCCDNNKYLVRHIRPFVTECSSDWIVAAADEPEEDKSKISCTLFKLEPVNTSEGREFRFRHIQLDEHACLWTCLNPDHRKNFGGLHGGSGAPDKDKFNVYTVVAWESLGKTTILIRLLRYNQ
ncbi:hypothetical protein M0R45_006166 [Rubus argutus]|uniref:Agglutinin domain-containing protein n=1 Tax=Rubus argutus TaxID=59490 RepID=A0AAW1YPN2_RUBAR